MLVAKDPTPPARAEVWLRRGEDVAATRRCRKEFEVGNVRATHETQDARGAAALKDPYERTIDLGAHPNQLGVLSSTQRTETDQVEAAVGALRAFGLVLPERFAIARMDEDVDRLAAEHNVVFKRYVPAAR